MTQRIPRAAFGPQPGCIRPAHVRASASCAEITFSTSRDTRSSISAACCSCIHAFEIGDPHAAAQFPSIVSAANSIACCHARPMSTSFQQSVETRFQWVSVMLTVSPYWLFFCGHSIWVATSVLVDPYFIGGTYMGAKPHCKLKGVMRAVLARNLGRELKRKWPLLNETNRNRALSKAAHISPETVRRILNQDVGPSIDTLEIIAEQLEIAPYSLLQPSVEMRRKFEIQDSVLRNSESPQGKARGSHEGGAQRQ